MSDLAGRTTGGTVSVIVVLAVVVLALAVLGALALWRIFSDAAEPGWAAVVPGYNVVVWLRIRRRRRSEPGRRRRVPRAPAAVAGAAVVLVIALALGYFLATDSDAPAGDLTTQESEAVTAASTIAANLSTYSRTAFAKDYDRALSGTVDSLHTQVEKLRSTTQSTLTQGKFDLKATVRHAALVGKADPSTKSKDPDSYVVLVNLYGFQSTAPTTPIPQNLRVTVEKIKGKWLASDVTLVTLV